MIKHIVMWRLKDRADGTEAKERLEALNDSVEAISHLEVGINEANSPAAYDLVLYSEFENTEALENYVNHPDHLRVVSFMKQIVSERAVVDYHH